MIHDLAIVLAIAALTGLIARRLGQPGILGYLFAGLIVGPYIPIPLFADPARITELSHLGVVLVMFAVGLEFRIKTLGQILPLSGLTGLIQIGALMLLGAQIGDLLGWSSTAGVCLGATIAISSTMVVTGIFRQMEVEEDVRTHVLGVLVVQDIAAILLIAVVTALAEGRSVDPRSLGHLVGQLAGMVVGMLVIGLLVVPRLVRYTLDRAGSEGLVVLAAGLAFLFAAVAHAMGYSDALGAFLAGMVVAESGRAHDVEVSVEPLRAVFAAIFFVSIGMTVDPRVAWASAPFALVISAVVIVGQLLFVFIGSVLSGLSLRRSVLSGLALGQIGELSFIIAGIAIAGQVLEPRMLPVLVMVATITAFTTPLLLRASQRIVDRFDRWVPDVVHHALALYQATIRRAEASKSDSLRRPAMAVVLDWMALLLLLIVRQAVLTAPAIRARSGIVDTAVVIVALPFIVGLIRSSRLLIRRLHGNLGTIREPGQRVLAHLVTGMTSLTVLLAIGLPTWAVLHPFIDGSWLGGVVIALVVIAAVIIGRRARRADATYSSSAARLAQRIAAHAQDPEPEPQSPSLEIEHVTLTLAADSPAANHTLIEVNLRARTGATVVAIQHAGSSAVLPTGHERLLAGDVLALSGSRDALDRARAVLEADG